MVWSLHVEPGMRVILVFAIAGCVHEPSHTYTVGVDQLVGVEAFFAWAGAPPTDGIALSAPEDANLNCPVLADDVTITLGGVQLEIFPGGYDDGCGGGAICDQPPSCIRPTASALSPAPAPATIELQVSDSRAVARMTVVDPYVQRAYTAPAMLVPGTTASIAWTPSTDTFASPTTINCVQPTTENVIPTVILEAALSPGPTDVALTCHNGELSFPVPSSTSYRGPLSCLGTWTVSAPIPACEGFMHCSAIGPLPMQTFTTML